MPLMILFRSILRVNAYIVFRSRSPEALQKPSCWIYVRKCTSGPCAWQRGAGQLVDGPRGTVAALVQVREGECHPRSRPYRNAD